MATLKSVNKRKVIEAGKKPLSLAPLDFETAIRLTLDTGPMPKRKTKKRRKKK